MILQILTKNDQQKERANEEQKGDNDSDATGSEEFLYPHGYQFPPEKTLPQSNDAISLMIELTPAVREVQPSDVEHI